MVRATRTCGWCGIRCNMTQFGNRVELGEDDFGNSTEFHLVFQCDGCSQLSIVKCPNPTEPWDSLSELVSAPSASWLPHQVARHEFQDVPPAISSLAVEAHTCLAVRADRAAAAMARAVVEATAKAKGITTGSLAKKIDKLFEQQLIREYVRDAAHEIRFGGNEVAHGDLVDEPMDHDTATEILGLMDEMLDEVFQSPARVERRRRAPRSGSTTQCRAGADPSCQRVGDPSVDQPVDEWLLERATLLTLTCPGSSCGSLLVRQHGPHASSLGATAVARAALGTALDLMVGQRTEEV